jgi:hypothetical protein
VTAPAGSLRLLRNAIINAGAEIEKRAAFVSTFDAPAGSLGCLSTTGTTYVVMNGTSAPVYPSGRTPGIVYIPFQTTYDRVASWDLYSGAFYIVMHGTNGRYYHYYAQNFVTDAMATSSAVKTYGEKMYGVDGSILRFSAIDKPQNWTPPTGTTNDGSGWIDLSVEDGESVNLVGLEIYYGQLAVFSQISTQFWQVAGDPSQNAFKQLLRQTGSLAANTVTQFGNGDIVYLSPRGVRSVRAQNVTLTAGVTDVGTPLDNEIRPLLWSNGAGWFANARTFVEPRSGRLWLVLQDRIYVLTTFQEPTITAWSRFDPPGASGTTITDSCVADPYVMLRCSDNVIYQYAGWNQATYDATQAEVITPALSFDKPHIAKVLQGFDVGCVGTWSLSVAQEPTDQTDEELIATFTGATYSPYVAQLLSGTATHVSLRLRTTDAQQATLGNLMIFYEGGAEG